MKRKNLPPPPKVKQGVFMSECVWRSNIFNIKCYAQINTVCEGECQYLNGFIILFIIKTKVNVMADNRLRCVICILRPTQTHTMQDREFISLFHTYAHFPTSCQGASKQTPYLLTWHNANAFFFKTNIVDILFYSSVKKNLNITLSEMHGVLLRGSERQLLYSSDCKDAKKEIEGGKRRARTLLGMLNNTINQALGTA